MARTRTPGRAAIHAQLAEAHAALASTAATALAAAATVYARGGAWAYCDEDVTAWGNTVGASQVHAG